MRWRQQVVALGGLVSVLVLGCTAFAYAQSASNSTNYSVDQVFFGAGGELNACSSGPTGYCSKQSAGEIAAGNTAGTAFRAQAGFNTDRSPYIAFSVAASSADLGTLSTVGTATTNATFAVKTYLASGYVVTVASDSPTNLGNGHHLDTNGSPTSPTIGVEQFGMNLIANTSPINFGAPPVEVPDNTFSFGTVATGYDQLNKYKYTKGDIIAQSTKSSGETDYTASFIYNIGSVTPDGTYQYDGVFVATSTY